MTVVRVLHAVTSILPVWNIACHGMQVYGKKSPMWLNVINGTLCGLLLIVTFVSSISSIRYIVVDSVNYHVFANL